MKKLIILFLVMLITWPFLISNKEKTIDLKIQFTNDDEIIYLPLTKDEEFKCFSIIRGFNGQVSVSQQTVDLSYQHSVVVVYEINFKNQSKKYRKTFIVKQFKPEIMIENKYIDVLVDQTIEYEKLYKVVNQGNWLLQINNAVDTTAVGQYPYHIILTDGENKVEEVIYINVLPEKITGCNYVYVIDKEEVMQQGHYQYEWVEPVGHYENILVSQQQGHYQTIHHPAITYQKAIYQSYKLYTFYHQDQSKNIVIEDYLLFEKTGYSSASSYFVYLAQNDEGYLGYFFENKDRIVGYETIVEKPAWDETIWVVDQPAQYQQQYIIDAEGYYKQVWIIDVPYQKQQGHFEKICE